MRHHHDLQRSHTLELRLIYTSRALYFHFFHFITPFYSLSYNICIPHYPSSPLDEMLNIFTSILAFSPIFSPHMQNDDEDVELQLLDSEGRVPLPVLLPIPCPSPRRKVKVSQAKSTVVRNIYLYLLHRREETNTKQTDDPSDDELFNSHISHVCVNVYGAWVEIRHVNATIFFF